MLENLKEEVFFANLELVEKKMVIYTWGNVSAISEDRKYVVIKPSGVSYETLRPEDMVVVDLEGNVVEGNYRPSSDTATHLEIYKNFPQVGGVVHTHSPYAVSWAQAGKSIPCFGTTHADYFYGDIPITRNLTDEEMKAYEKNTGTVIVEAFKGKDPLATPGVLVVHHGPFAWGKNAGEAVYHGVVLEEVAKMALQTLSINPEQKEIPGPLMDKHYYRKHGDNATYGQG